MHAARNQLTYLLDNGTVVCWRSVRVSGRKPPLGNSLYVRFLQSAGEEDWTILLAGLPAKLPAEHALFIRLLRITVGESSRPLQYHRTRVLRRQVRLRT